MSETTQDSDVVEVADYTYENKVGGMLWELGIGQIFLIGKFVRPANLERFVATVKWYIDRRFGAVEGWQIEFSNDYSKVRKIEIK